jgi:GNAT superfamily N-acetyltransferase
MLPNETRTVEWYRGGYTLSTDRDRVDMDRVYRFLAEESYWAQGMSRELIIRSIKGAITLGIYTKDRQVGFARVVTDCARFAYLLDVFIDRDHRGRGLGTWLAEMVQTHPDLVGVGRWLLTTADAHQVYERAGWKPVRRPEQLMEVSRG